LYNRDEESSVRLSKQNIIFPRTSDKDRKEKSPNFYSLGDKIFIGADHICPL